MSLRPQFRFVHASNLELDRFCSAPTDGSHDQARLLIDAPFRAAERVFETAIARQANLILLAGGTFVGRSPSTWGASFLARQCERAARLHIQVVWVDPGHERDRCWPRYLPFPRNLHHSNASSASSVRLGDVLDCSVSIDAAVDAAALRGSPEASSPRREATVRIAAVTADPHPAVDLGRPYHYWAIQGGAQPVTFPTTHGMARTAGTPQPRTISDAVPGGCLLVEVGEGSSLGSEWIETNSLRYTREDFSVNDSVNWEGFRRQAHIRLDELLRQTSADALLGLWSINGHGPVVERLFPEDQSLTFQQEIRKAFAGRGSSLWMAPLAVTPDAVQEAARRAKFSRWAGFVRLLDALPATGSGPVDLAALSGEPAFIVDPAASEAPRPHFDTVLKHAARRRAADLLSRLK